MPKSAKHNLYMSLVLAMIAVIASGCGESASLTAPQVLEKAASAISAANSFHFKFESSKPQKPIPGFFINSAEGSVAKPDKLIGDLNASYAGLAIKTKVIVDGKNQYMTDVVTGKWTTMSAALNVMQFFDPAKGVSDIIANIAEAQSDGSESIDGTDTYRIKGTVPAVALKSLSQEVQASVDLPTTLWIGSSDFLLRKVQLNGALMAGETADTITTISFSDFNKDVKIETPLVEK